MKKKIKINRQCQIYKGIFDGNEWRKNYAYLDFLIRRKMVIVDEWED